MNHAETLRPLLVVGTRPEGIKMAPVILLCQAQQEMEPIVCFTGQHREMLAQVADYFSIRADVDLELMQPNQTLAGFTARCLERLDETVQRFQPDCLVAQGDTTTVMAASVVAFYRKLPLVHVEAGLRTGDLQSPWPEEFNRRVASLTAAIHCAPTEAAAENLRAEGIAAHSVYVTGNTVIDSLLWTVEKERSRGDFWQRKYSMLGDARLVLITGHRRENFGEKFQAICRAIARLAQSFPDCEFIYPVHLNPHVRQPVYEMLCGLRNVHLTEPASYPEFVWLMDRATLILTDSGGVQEEAPSLRKPVLLMRDTTERPEAVAAGAVKIVGTCEESIVNAATSLLNHPQIYARHQLEKNPYGDGQASRRICELMLARSWLQPPLARRAA